MGVIRAGCAWRRRPSANGPHAAIHDRVDGWSGKGLRKRIFGVVVAGNRIAEPVSMDASDVRARRPAHGGKAGLWRRPSAVRAAAKP